MFDSDKQKTAGSFSWPMVYITLYYGVTHALWTVQPDTTEFSELEYFTPDSEVKSAVFCVVVFFFAVIFGIHQ